LRFRGLVRKPKFQRQPYGLLQIHPFIVPHQTPTLNSKVLSADNLSFRFWTEGEEASFWVFFASFRVVLSRFLVISVCKPFRFHDDEGRSWQGEEKRVKGVRRNGNTKAAMETKPAIFIERRSDTAERLTWCCGE